MLLTPTQVSVLAYVSTKPRPPRELNTTTLASLARRGAVELKAKHVVLTTLGRAAYQFNMRREYSAWRDDLKKVKKWKRTV